MMIITFIREIITHHPLCIPTCHQLRRWRKCLFSLLTSRVGMESHTRNTVEQFDQEYIKTFPLCPVGGVSGLCLHSASGPHTVDPVPYSFHFCISELTRLAEKLRVCLIVSQSSWKNVLWSFTLVSFKCFSFNSEFVFFQYTGLCSWLF